MVTDALPSSQSQSFELEQLADGVYAAIALPQTGSIGNAGIVDLGDRCLVFDTFATPVAAADLKAAAARLTGHPVAYAVNSHWHMDHFQGNQVFASDAVILATPATRQRILEDASPRLERDKAEALQELHELEEKLGSAAEREWAELTRQAGFVRQYLEAVADIRVTPPDLTFEGRVQLHGPRRTVELIEGGAGHTLSDTVLYLRDEGVLFSGDLVTVNQHPWCLDCDPEGWVRVLGELASLGADRVVPGHGPLGSVDNILAVRDYVGELHAKALDLRRVGAETAHLQSVAVPERYSAWRNPGMYSRNLAALAERGRDAAQH